MTSPGDRRPWPTSRSATREWPGPKPGSILLSHATGFCKDVWAALAEELTATSLGMPIVAWDYGSHGAAAKLDHPIDWWDFGRQAADMAGGRLAPRIGVGHSMGAAAVAMAEVLEPGLFDLLVLVEPIVFPPPYRRIADNPMSEVAIKRRRFYESREEALANFAEKSVFDRWDQRALHGYVAGGLAPVPDGFEMACRPEDEAEVFAAASAHGLYDRIGEIQCPSVVVIGEHSDTHTMGVAEDLAGRMGGPSRAELFMGASHFLPMEQPVALARLIEKQARLHRLV